MATLATAAVRSCPRCFAPININQRIERYKIVDGKQRWAHVGCEERSLEAPVPERNGRGISARTTQQMAERMVAATTAGGMLSSTPQPGRDDQSSGNRLSHDDLRQVVSGMVEAEMAPTKDRLDRAVADLTATVEREVARRVAEAISSQLPVEVIHRFEQRDGTTTSLDGEVLHPQFERLLRLARAGKPIFLPGPTGCGKTHTAMQLARVLFPDQPEKFGMLSCSPGMSESQILGRSVPNIATGEEVYRASEFVRIFEEGGVFLFDEMDAADPSVLLVINSALANGRVPVPNRPGKPIAERHPDFVCIAAANTWGTGASREYCGRNPLDEATLDRFRIGTVPCNYEETIERALCPNRSLFSTIKAWRKKMMELGIKRVISTRFFRDAYDLMEAGDTIRDIELCLFGGWKEEETVKVLGRPVK